MIYVQLDKCLEQFRAGQNSEAEDGKPDELQLWLAMIADVNDGKVSEAVEKDDELKKIRAEALNMAQDKEVQNMMIKEKYDRMDILTYGNDQRREGAIKEAIMLYREEMGLLPTDIIKKIMTRFNMKQDVAEKYVEETLGLQPV